MTIFKRINIACWLFYVWEFCAVVTAKSCQGTATYKLSFQAEWMNTSSRPLNAKFSGLIGCSHNHCYQMWKPGRKASLGVKNVAEEGHYRVLYNEILKHIEHWKPKIALNLIQSINNTIDPEGNVILPETNTDDDGFRVDSLHPLVSVIAGIIPSPDWFIGVQDVNLCNISSGDWLKGSRHILFPYDAGTDSGQELSNASINKPTIPRQNVASLKETAQGDLISSSIRGMGYFQFTLVKKFPAVGSKVVTDDNGPCPNVASLGDFSALQDEIMRLMRNRTTLQVFTQDVNSIEPQGTTNLNDFQVDALRPWVSVIMKIFPSPDWFVGVRDIDLCNRKNGVWLHERKVFPILPYDAGTDSGTQFMSSDNPSSPREISRIRGEPLTYWIKPERIRGMGLFHFSRKVVTAGGPSVTDETFECPNLASERRWSYLILIPAILLLYHV